MNSFIHIFLGLGAMLIALTVHEFCHGLAAFLMGDETAKRAGRLTLNPVAHIDPIGTILIPLLGAFSGVPIFGWAKPVPYNPHNLMYKKWGPALVAFAGPGSNFLSAILALIGLKLSLTVFGLGPNNLLVIFLVLLVSINVVLGVFNFIPVPPLDGSNMLSVFLDHPKYRETRFLLETKGPMFLMIFILLDFYTFHILGTIFGAAISFTFSLAGL